MRWERDFCKNLYFRLIFRHLLENYDTRMNPRGQVALQAPLENVFENQELGGRMGGDPI